MLLQQQKIQFSEFSGLYDLIVPKENLLRKINELIDFGFIYDELLDKYCSDNGRNAERPVRMFKYLLLKTIYTVSDVDVARAFSLRYVLQIFSGDVSGRECDQFKLIDQVPKAPPQGYGSFKPSNW